MSTEIAIIHVFALIYFLVATPLSVIGTAALALLYAALRKPHGED